MKRRKEPPVFLPTGLYNLTDTAYLMQRSRRTIYTMVSKFELRSIPRGRKGKLVPGSEILRWEAAHMVGSATELKAALDGRRS